MGIQTNRYRQCELKLWTNPCEHPTWVSKCDYHEEKTQLAGPRTFKRGLMQTVGGKANNSDVMKRTGEAPQSSKTKVFGLGYSGHAHISSLSHH